MLQFIQRQNQSSSHLYALFRISSEHKISQKQTNCLMLARSLISLAYKNSMDRQLLMEDSKILELVTITYTSPDTQQIDEAYQLLIRYAFDVYPRSFLQLQEIIAKKKYPIDTNCKKAIINLIKVTGSKMIETLSLLNKADDDVISNHKRLLHAVEHIFDNKQIESSLKAPVGQLYIDLFLFFTPENYPRLISKCRFYFNTRQYFLALTITEIYLSRKMALKYRFPFCQQSLQLVIFQLCKKVLSIRTTETYLSEASLQVLMKFFHVLTELWDRMTFQKFQSVFQQVLVSEPLINLIVNLNSEIFGNFWKKPLHHLYYIIVVSLGRCNIFSRYQRLVELIHSAAADEILGFVNGEQKQVETLSFMAAAIQYKLLQLSLSSYDLFTKIIYPNYLIIEKYLESQADNLPEVINFLEDVTFYMESETQEVLRHKILYLLCKNCEQIAISFRSLIYTFYCRHISTLANGQIKEVTFNVNLQEGMNAWDQIKMSISENDQIEVILLYSAISAKFFISELEFMKKIEEFTSENEDYLLLNQNKKIQFYSLLLFKNYMDDIFSSHQNGGFRQKIVLYAIDNQTDKIIKDFSIQILKQKLSQKPPFDQFSREIEMILKKMVEDYQEQLIPLAIVVFKEFGQYISKESAVLIIKQTLAIWQGKEIQQDKKSLHLQLLKLFLNISSCKEYFMILVEELVKIASNHVGLVQRHIEQFLQVVAKGAEICQQLPSHFQETVTKFDITVSSIQTMQVVNQLITHASQDCFFNWLAVMLTKNNLNIYEILLLHNLIYYGNKALSYDSIRLIISVSYLERIYRRNRFDYRNGKISLIIVFLLKYMWKETNEMLLGEDWSDLIERGRSLTANINQLARAEERPLLPQKPFIEQIYDLIYKEENIYRWKYDIELFLVSQLDLFKYQIADHYQLMYANLSFLACSLNIIRAYEFIQNHFVEQCSDSDDSIYPHSKIEKEYRGTQEIIDRFVLPVPLKETDYFTLYKKAFVSLKRDENSKKWVDTLFKTAFKPEQFKALDNAMKIQKNAESSYRKIKKVRRIREGDNDDECIL